MANITVSSLGDAASSSSMASSSASPSYSDCDVFINHRGPDVKNTFASHLYRRLSSSYLRVFFDRESMKKGENFISQIEQAIRAASVHIAIFSPRYAQSKWCLKELVLMVKSGATILPVFYKVDPSVVRLADKSGAYFEALRVLEQKTTRDCETDELKPRHSSDTIQEWRNALSSVADIDGFQLHGDEDDEGELLDNVVKCVLKKVPKPLLDVAKHPTWLNLKIEEFEERVLSVFRPTFASNLYRLLSSALRQVSLQVVKSIFRFQSASYPDYDVFISHRGPDVKAIFVTDLYRCLVACGFQVFLDEPEMRVGDHIPCQIKHAIETASIHIAIFSPTYAQSRWCLEELQHMWMECESGQASIVPVFYEVEPSVVRGARKGQTGAYAKALSEQEEKRPANFETIKKWRKALFDVANISGLELKKCNGGKDELLANVVKHLLNIREKSRLKYVLKENFGSTVFAILHRRAQLQSQGGQGLPHRIYNRVKVRWTVRIGKPKFMGIVGAAGMGMTKLAKEFEEKNKSRYSGSCLLSDVKESSPVSLLRKILEDLTRLNEQIDTVEQGIHKLKERISTCKASKYLIILNDVDDDAQMKALSPIWDVLSSNSFILVTSRYRDVLIGAGIKEASIYDLRSGSRTNLILAGDWLVELPPCLNQVKNLKELWLRDSPNLERLSTRFFQLQTRSSRSGSYPLLNRLTELTITDCGIIFLSQELQDMNNLKVLRVCNCPFDELSFTKEVKTISESDARLHTVLKGVCPNLQHLWIYSCTDLVKVGSMPTTLKTVDFSYCIALREIKGLPDLAGLEQLDISGCEEVEELPSLQTLKSLKSLKASKCYKLKSIKGLADLSRLQRLYVRDCHEIQELPGVEHCRSLKALDASKCYKLKSIKGLADLSRLQRLYVRDCHEIRELPCVENCRSLKALDARDCPKLQWADGVLDQLRQHLETCLVGYYDDGH